MRFLGTLALTCALTFGLAIGSAAQGECDWEALVNESLDGETSWILDDFGQDAVDDAIADIEIVVLPEGETIEWEVFFEDWVHVVGADCTLLLDNNDNPWWIIAWDQTGGVTYTYPDDVMAIIGSDEDRDLVGGGRGNGLGENGPYGMFIAVGPGSTLTFQAVIGGALGPALIENLVMFDTDADPWQIRTNIQLGDDRYTDRGTTIDVLPEFYLGLDWIRTSNDSADWRDGNPDVIATFDVTTPVTVYIAFDERVDVPPCFTDWEETGDTLVGDVDYNIRSMDFSAGTIEMCRYEDDAGFYTIMVESTGPAGPSLSLNVEGATFAEEGGSLMLSANDSMMAPYQWHLDGVDMFGVTNATLSLSPTGTDDSGVYTLEFDDGVAKATLTSNPVFVAIFPLDSLPVTSLLGLGLLALTSALAGGTVLARMKR